MRTRFALTAGVAGICLATLGATLPATAATVPAVRTTASPTSDSTSSSRIQIDRRASVVVLNVAAPDGTTVTATDASGAVLAGSRATHGSAAVSIAAPTRTATYTVSEVVSGAAGASPVGTITLEGAEAGSLPAPTIDDISSKGGQSVISATAEPGSVLKVTDENDVLRGVKIVGSSGTVSVPLTVPEATDQKLSVSQSANGAVSSGAEADVYGPTRVDTQYVAERGAVVEFTSPLGTSWDMDIRDESGDWVSGGKFSLNGPTLRTLPLVPGKINHFTVARGSNRGSGTPGSDFSALNTTSFDIDARQAKPVAVPTVDPEYTLGGIVYTRFTGITGASILVTRVGDPAQNPLFSKTFGASQSVVDIDHVLQPSTTYQVEQHIEGSKSSLVTFTTPAA